MAIRRSNVVASRGRPRQVSRPAIPPSFPSSPAMGPDPLRQPRDTYAGAATAYPGSRPIQGAPMGGSPFGAQSGPGALMALLQRGAQPVQPRAQPNLNVPPSGYGGYGQPMPNRSSYQGLGMNPSVIQMLLATMGPRRIGPVAQTSAKPTGGFSGGQTRTNTVATSGNSARSPSPNYGGANAVGYDRLRQGLRYHAQPPQMPTPTWGAIPSSSGPAYGTQESATNVSNAAQNFTEDQLRMAAQSDMYAAQNLGIDMYTARAALEEQTKGRVRYRYGG